jgi:cardiolipin synthase
MTADPAAAPDRADARPARGPTADGDPEGWTLYLSQRDAHPAMLADIRRARRTIELEQFIFNDDAVGRPVVDALVERARAGVRVRVLVDAIGSVGLVASGAVEEMEQAGIGVRVFHPPHKLVRGPVLRFSRRTHRKILTVDGRVAHVGGAGLSEAMAAWRDVNLRLGGAVVDEIIRAFEWLWTKPRPPWAPLRPPVEDGAVRFVTTATARRHSPIYDHLIDAVERAERQITFTTPYFVPDGRFRRAIAEASARGVAVRLLVPETGDQPPADALTWVEAVRAMRHGVEVRTWPAMMHGKVQIVDDRWVTVGSSNLDCLSFFGNEEGNLVAARRDLATALREAIDRQFAEADPLTEARWRARPWPKKLLGRLARPLRPVL